MEIQTRIPAALVAIHNFIQLHDHDEGQLPGEEMAAGWHTHDQEDRVEPVGTEQREDDLMNKLRDQIAADMWRDYQRILVERRSCEDSDDMINKDVEDGNNSGSNAGNDSDNTDDDMAIDEDV
jgi:hypothetical protein